MAITAASPRRTGHARVRAIEESRKNAVPPSITIVGGADLPIDVARRIRDAIDEQRRREQG